MLPACYSENRYLILAVYWRDEFSHQNMTYKSEAQKRFPSHPRRDKIETILQDTLFQPRPLLEDTVQKTLADVLVIREDILTRTKSIRSEDGEVTICPEQGIKQEEKLTEIRMSGSTKPKWRAF